MRNRLLAVSIHSVHPYSVSLEQRVNTTAARHMSTSCRLKTQVSWVSEELSTFRKHRHSSKPGQVHAPTQATSQPSHNDANFHLGSVIG